MTQRRKHIVVGLSGGVDSSVAALLLKEQGYQVTGVFMQNWEAEADDPYCRAKEDLSETKIICNKLSIPLHTVNFSKEYWDNVFQYFLDTLAAGETPNPDILCNQEIKFKAFLNYALTLGANGIATGHYAKISQSNDFKLEKAADSTKDQTYFLHRLNQFQLSCSVFPLADFKKSQVRQIAKERGLINYDKKDSTGICFIGEKKFKAFLKEYLLAKPGNIETEDGKVLGKHQGLMFYTLGQRQGLGIGGHKQYLELPWYVIEKDLARNVLIVGQAQNHPLLLKDHLYCSNVNWIANHPPLFPLHCTAKIRYRQADQPCQVFTEDGKRYKVVFNHLQRAITPGQSVVFYQQEACLGGGIIESETKGYPHE